MKKEKLPKIIAIVGPTASGKTGLSLKLAKKFNGEVVNADSRQIYKGMNIGTAKEKKDKNKKGYFVNGIQHHLIDIANPDDEFTLAHYKKVAFTAIDDILKRKKLPIITGGTGLYIKAIVENYDIPAVAPDLILRQELNQKSLLDLVKMLKNKDPKVAKKIDLKNPRRVIRALELALSDNGKNKKIKKSSPLYQTLQIGLNPSRQDLYERINKRVEAQIKNGLVNEVKKLAKKYSFGMPSMSGIGYRQIGFYLRGEKTLVEAIEMIKRDTRRYAKRQMTWFKKEKDIKWIKNQLEAEKLINEFIKSRHS